MFRIELFFLSQDPWKKRRKTESTGTSRIFLNFIFSTLNIVLFYKVTLKPNQKHHLDPIGLLMNRSGSGFLKSWSGSAKSGSIRIRNTENPRAIYCSVAEQALPPDVMATTSSRSVRTMASSFRPKFTSRSKNLTKKKTQLQSTLRYLVTKTILTGVGEIKPAWVG